MVTLIYFPENTMIIVLNTTNDPNFTGENYEPEDNDDHEPDLLAAPDQIRNGHQLRCRREPTAHERLTITCTRCDDFREAYQVSGPVADVEKHVAEFMSRWDNPGSRGREESRSQPTPETLEVTLGRRAVCD